MENNFNNFELLLGYDPVWEEYVIVEHHDDHPNRGDSYCFQVGADSISDGDGALASYDDTFVKIDEKDYHHAIGLFHKAGEEMCALCQKCGQPILRPIVAGDYIYDCGYFLHIQNISSNREKLWIEQFYYDTYDLNLDTDLEVVEKDDDYDISQIESDGLIISEDVYRQALNIAKSTILEITDYLQRLMIQINSQKISK